MKKTIAVLCAAPASIYNQFQQCDVYDKHRDALTYTGDSKIIAHPPCRHFSRLRNQANQDSQLYEHLLARTILGMVIKNGGVLEHPAQSTLFSLYNLPRPGESSQHGFTIALPQIWFGHKALKKTWFFIAGIDPQKLPQPPYTFDNVTRRVEDMSPKERSATPLPLAQWLIDLVS